MRRILISAGLLTCMCTGMAQAANDHWDRPSCYIYVHGQCYPPGKPNQCGPGGYEDALDECDGYYPSPGGRPDDLVSKPAVKLGKRAN